MKEVRLAMHLSRDMLDQWKAVRNRNLQQGETVTEAVQRWQPPEKDYVKCNIVAALFGEQRCFGIGTCIRNSHGHFIKAQSKSYEGVPSPPEAEVLGLRDAILWLDNLGLSKVHIELDCKLVVDNIVDSSKNESEFGNIITICRIMLQQHPNSKITFVRRQANCVAHPQSNKGVKIVCSSPGI